MKDTNLVVLTERGQIGVIAARTSIEDVNDIIRLILEEEYAISGFTFDHITEEDIEEMKRGNSKDVTFTYPDEDDGSTYTDVFTIEQTWIYS